MEEELKLDPGDKLDDAVSKLLVAKNNGKRVYCVFNGVANTVILHSDDVSMDSAYIAVVGCTKKEADQRMRKGLESFIEGKRLELEKAKGKIPIWIERGEKLIYPERYEEWAKRVVRCANGIYAGTEVETALEIMTALENGATIEEAKQMFEARGESALIARSLIFSFSKQGPEFFEAVMYPTEEFRKPEIEAKKRENQELARINAKNTRKHI